MESTSTSTVESETTKYYILYGLGLGLFLLISVLSLLGAIYHSKAWIIVSIISVLAALFFGICLYLTRENAKFCSANASAAICDLTKEEWAKFWEADFWTKFKASN